MVDPALEEFFAKRKEAWLKAKLKNIVKEDEVREIEREGEDIFSLENWLPKASSRACSRAITTHPSKFQPSEYRHRHEK